MTRFSPLPVLCGSLLALLLTACGSDAPGVDPAAAGNGVSATPTGNGQSDPSPGAAGSGDPGVPAEAAEAGSGSRPGAPEPETEGGGLPGGPFDLEAFENIGGPFSGLRASTEDRCGGGACHLVDPPDVIDGDPAALEGGIDECRVDTITYDPASEVRADGEYFQEGSAVLAHVDCDPTNDVDATADDTTTQESPATGATTTEQTDDGTPTGGTTGGGTTGGEPAG